MILLFSKPPAGGRHTIGFQTAPAALIMLFCVPCAADLQQAEPDFYSKNPFVQGMSP